VIVEDEEYSVVSYVYGVVGVWYALMVFICTVIAVFDGKGIQYIFDTLHAAIAMRSVDDIDIGLSIEIYTQLPIVDAVLQSRVLQPDAAMIVLEYLCESHSSPGVWTEPYR